MFSSAVYVRWLSSWRIWSQALERVEIIVDKGEMGEEEEEVSIHLQLDTSLTRLNSTRPTYLNFCLTCLTSPSFEDGTLVVALLSSITF